MGAGASAADEKVDTNRVKFCFEKLDLNKDGFVDQAELVSFCNDNQMAGEIIEKADTNQDKKISETEWLNLFQTAEGEEAEKAKSLLFDLEYKFVLGGRVADSFKKLDTENVGALGKDDAMNLIKSKATAMDKETLASQFFDDLDANSDGKVTIEEWENFFKKALRRSMTVPLNILGYVEFKLLEFDSLKELHDKMDTNKSGEVSKEELVALFSGEEACEVMSNAVMQHCDVNSDNKISVDEWTSMFVNEANNNGFKSAQDLKALFAAYVAKQGDKPTEVATEAVTEAVTEEVKETTEEVKETTEEVKETTEEAEKKPAETTEATEAATD